LKRSTKFLMLAALAIVLLLPMATGNPSTNAVNQNRVLDADNSLQIRHGNLEVAGIQDEADWWNSTYIYRRYFNFTEPGISSRTLSPVHLYLTFVEGHCVCRSNSPIASRTCSSVSVGSSLSQRRLAEI